MGVTRLLRSTATGAFAARALGMVGALAMSIAIMRALPRSEAGAVVLAYTLLSVAAIFARYGSDNLTLREVSTGRRDAADVVAHSVRLTVTLAPLAMAGLAVSLLARGDEASVVVAACAGVVFAALSPVSGAALRGLGRVTSGALAELGSPTLLAALGIAVLGLTGRANTASVVWVITAAYAMTAVWAWPLVMHSLRARSGVPHDTEGAGGFGSFVRTFRPSLTSFFANTLGFFLLAWLPVLALGYQVIGSQDADQQVALYNAGARVSQLVPVLATVQISYLSQRFALHHHLGDRDTVNRLAQASTWWATAWAVAVVVPCLVAPEALLQLFGDYADAATGLRVLSVGALAVVLLGPVTGLMLTCGHERAAGRVTMLSLAVAVPLLVVLAPAGHVAVAVGICAVSLMYTLVCAVTLRRDGIRATPLLR